MIIHNVAIAKQLADHIDQTTNSLKTRLANMLPNMPHEAQISWSLRGEIQGLERLKKALLEEDTDKE